MKPPVTNISAAEHPMPPAAASAADGDAHTGNGHITSAAPATSNVIRSATYTGQSAVTAAGDASVTGMIESAFLAKFREKFVESDGEHRWPRPSVNTKTEFSTEFTDLFRSLFMRLEAATPAPAGNPGSAKQMVRELLEETGWPDKDRIPVPEPWNSNTHDNNFRRYEIVCAVNILMKSYDSLVGGGIGGYPPDH